MATSGSVPRPLRSLITMVRGRRSNGIRVPARVWRLIQAGDRARDRDDLLAATDAYEHALARRPDLAHIWIQLGHALKDLGRLDPALQAYRRAIRVLPTDAEPLVWAGQILTQQERPFEALNAFVVAAAIDGGAIGTGRLIEQAAAAARRDDERLLRERLPGYASTLRGVNGVVAQGMVDVIDGLSTRAAPPIRSSPALVYDISDLFSYFDYARLPTGIQRVQLETVRAALLRDPDRVRLCCFIESRSDWLSVGEEEFLSFAATSTASADSEEAEWQAMLIRVRLNAIFGPSHAFAMGDTLINLGTSWWLQNYFLQVRNAKRAHGIAYVPFVHDLIPVLAPQHCVEGLVRDFLSWISGVFEHADHFLTNSNATRTDLQTVARSMGRTVSDDAVSVVRLDADFGSVGEGSALPQGVKEPFVLFVSTIESRKGHLVAFDAWSDLIARHGDAVPMLVCVGSAGWLNDAAHRRLAADPALAARVNLLSQVPDGVLRTLYRRCRFTVYPSLFEGWGLPVTESLCHGKVPIVTNCTSLPEAGGTFALYVSPGSAAELAGAVESLAWDDDLLRAREARIARDFRPRSWNEIAAQIAHEMVEVRPSAEIAPQIAERCWLTLGRTMATRLPDVLPSGENLRLRSGWKSPGDWGCLLVDSAALVFRVEGKVRVGSLSLRLRNPADVPIAWSVMAEGRRWGGRLSAGERATATGCVDADWDGVFDLTIACSADALHTDAPTKSVVLGVEAVRFERF